jgi:hypothetical protein
MATEAYASQPDPKGAHRGEMTHFATDIDRKLCLTAGLIGAVTRKDLVAAFVRVNPHTAFELERAHKWLQGRARPREQRLYDDWALVLDVGRPGDWIADCELSNFINVLCERSNLNRDQLLKRARAFGGGSDETGAFRDPNAGGPSLAELVGTYVCYSHAWSPYFQGRIIRGAMIIDPGDGCLTASYAESLPTGQVLARGPVNILRKAIHLSLRDAEGTAGFLFSLFPASPPVSILGGLMCGPTILGSDPEPSVTRILIVRLPAIHPLLAGSDAYLASGASVAEDLAALGAPVSDPTTVESRLGEFLLTGDGRPTDRIPVVAYRALVESFDRDWIKRTYGGG